MLSMIQHRSLVEAHASRETYARLKNALCYKKYTSQLFRLRTDNSFAVHGISSGELFMSIQAISSGGSNPLSTNASAQQQATTAAQPTTSSSSQNSTAASASAQSASYSVTISSAARAAFAEATESSVQTAQEANRGDRQAQRLLAKEQANKIG
jgi:uncharacterized protein with von Willebrand factor type A (vWA) domain